MLVIDNLGFNMAGSPLFEGASARIPSGHKVGLVGRNGAGKTTLFRLILGELVPDAGSITLPANARIGQVAQEAPSSAASLLDTVLLADTERAALLAEAETTTDPTRIAEVQTRLADIEAHSAEARAATILNGLGFDRAAQAWAVAEYSGGWRMRVALAGVLFARPDLLLLDEPTNYLDLEGALWLETYLARYPHTALIISHDRALLNRAVGSILHLEQRRLTLYSGGYDRFDNTRRARLAVAEAEVRKQEAQRAHMTAFVERFRAKASKARQAQSRLKALARMQPIAQTPGEVTLPFNFPTPEELSPPILTLDRVSAGYDGKPVLSGLTLRIDQDDRIALLGANGQGKSTLSKLLADRLAPLSGSVTRARGLRVGYFAQHQVDELNIDETPLMHLRALRPGESPQKLRARLASGGIGADLADVQVGRLSGGQKARLSLLLATLDAPHLLILDEPTNHLDISAREALITALAEYSGAVILVSHDVTLIGLTADRLWLVRGGTVRPWEDDLDAYRKLLLSERGSGGAARTPANAPASAPVSSPASSPAPSSAPPPAPAPDPGLVDPRQRRAAIAALRIEASRCEARIAKLEQMRTQIDAHLADQGLYLPEKRALLAQLQAKRAEIAEGLKRAETLWLAAQDKLERAEAGR